VPNVESHIFVIFRHRFLAISNALINYRNDMLRLSFGNMTLDLNIFNWQGQLDGFDDVDHFTLNWVVNFFMMS